MHWLSLREWTNIVLCYPFGRLPHNEQGDKRHSTLVSSGSFLALKRFVTLLSYIAKQLWPIELLCDSVGSLVSPKISN